jgi:hypothetical protein
MSFPEWSERINKNDAVNIRDNGEFFGDGESEKGCYWRGYKHGNKCYIGLCSELDIWEVDEQTLVDYCG